MLYTKQLSEYCAAIQAVDSYSQYRETLTGECGTSVKCQAPWERPLLNPQQWSFQHHCFAPFRWSGALWQTRAPPRRSSEQEGECPHYLFLSGIVKRLQWIRNWEKAPVNVTEGRRFSPWKHHFAPALEVPSWLQNIYSGRGDLYGGVICYYQILPASSGKALLEEKEIQQEACLFICIPASTIAKSWIHWGVGGKKIDPGIGAFLLGCIRPTHPPSTFSGG